MLSEHCRDCRHGFTTDNPTAAHQDLAAAGWRQVPEYAAADPDQKPEGAVALYARGPRMAWLMVAAALSTGCASTDSPCYVGACVQRVQAELEKHRVCAEVLQEVRGPKGFRAATIRHKGETVRCLENPN